MKTKREVLIEARDVIKDKDGWCRFHHFELDDGSTINADDWNLSVHGGRIKKCCGDGALRLAAFGPMPPNMMGNLGSPEKELYTSAADALAKAVSEISAGQYHTTVGLNDGDAPEIAHHAMIKSFDFAIEQYAD